MSAEEPTLLDLRQTAVREQLGSVADLLGRAAGGEALTLMTNDDVVAKYILPAAAVAGLRCSVEPVEEGGWRLRLAPRPSPAAEQEEQRDR